MEKRWAMGKFRVGYERVCFERGEMRIIELRRLGV